MQLETFMFIGRSGCGKGTQAKLLIEYLRKIDPEHDVFHLETGAKFREFVKKKDVNYSSRLSAEIYDNGGLQPEFLTIRLWSDIFIDELRDDEHMVIDGTPRKLNEARVLDSAFKFYGRKKPHLLFLNISREEATGRLASRRRIDDNSAEIKARLDWYETEVVKAIEFYRGNDDYHFLDINAEQSVEDVHKEIVRLMFEAKEQS